MCVCLDVSDTRTFTFSVCVCIDLLSRDVVFDDVMLRYCCVLLEGTRKLAERRWNMEF